MTSNRNLLCSSPTLRRHLIRIEKYNLTWEFIRKVPPDKWGIELRKFEFDSIISGYCRFGRVLEIGCGTGELSLHIARYADEVIATEFNISKVIAKETEKVKFMYADGQDLSLFADKSFDLVFSSNVLEHIPRVDKCLAEVRRVVKDDGLVIHTVPTITWKIFNLSLHLPCLVGRFSKGSSQVNGSFSSSLNSIAHEVLFAKFLRRILPKPHGVSKTHIEEFWRWREGQWLKLFTKANFEIKRIVRLPFYHGHQKRFLWLLRFGNKLGLSSCTGYVLRPKTH